MAQTTTIAENFILEPGNMGRYELIYTVYKDHYYDYDMCSITWLKRSRGGCTFVWPKGESIYAHYALEKINGRHGTDCNIADLAPILRGVQKRFPDSIPELVGFEDYDENGCWRPSNS